MDEKEILDYLRNEGENRIWLVSYYYPTNLGVFDLAFDGVVPVIARGEYEAIGKAMTMDEMKGIPVDPASLRAYPLELKHSTDQYNIINLSLDEKFKSIFKQEDEDYSHLDDMF